MAIDTEEWFDVQKSDNFLYWYMDEYCFYDYNSALRRIKFLLEEKTQKVTLFY